MEKRAPNAVVKFAVQSHARHILLRTGPQVSQAAALAKLADARQRIVSGKADFQSLAREMSQDGSAQQGGDLGWASPGMFVPEFEEVMNRLVEGEVSAPAVSRFGVHLIQLIERRRIELGPRELRESVRNQLRETRYEEAFATWAQDVRGRAFVEMREPPAP
jgi:peptidyl-prolyl cis-trans isomerase SurA